MKLDIMGRDAPTMNRNKIRIFFLPTRHSISSGLYLVISNDFEEEDVRISFSYSDSSEPGEKIKNMMDSINKNHGGVHKKSDNSLDKIAKDKIRKFLELSSKYNFKSMKSQPPGSTWEDYEIPKEESSTVSENGYVKEKITIKNGLKNIPLNFILYGPPGTGKTYKTVDIAAGIIGGIKDGIDSVEKIINVDELKNTNENKFHEDNTEAFNVAFNAGRIHFVTFHQNYSYEEFVGGLRPDENNEDKLRFKWKPGIFIKACANALALAAKEKPSETETEQEKLENWFLEKCKGKNSYFHEKNKYDFLSERVVLIIDEINRANISRVFGELITLIESDKRIGGKHQLILTLPNGEKFGVPKNLIIMGTMNTADKSLALLDVALRRRFEFKGLFPKKDLVKDKEKKELFEIINNNILKKKGRDFQIGHSYFMDEDLNTIINGKVLPLLNEYFMGDNKKIKEVFTDTRKDTKKIDPQNDIKETDGGVLKFVGEAVNKKHTEQ